MLAFAIHLRHTGQILRPTSSTWESARATRLAFKALVTDMADGLEKGWAEASHGGAFRNV
jgi:hypothetical protein